MLGLGPGNNKKLDLPIPIMFNQEQEEELSESDTGKIIANCDTMIHIFRYIVNYSGFHHECLMLDLAL